MTMLNFDEIFVTRNWFGKPVRRDADTRFVKGEGSYVDDLNMDCVYAGFVRSPHAHARLGKIDTSKAEALKGVLAVMTGPEVAALTKPVGARAITRPARQHVMATGKVRYVGEPVAVVVAEDRYTVEDALDLVEVEYEPLPVVVDIDDAMKEGAPLVFEEAETNVLLHDTLTHGDIDGAFRQADLVVKEQFRIQRFSSTPLENWAIIAKHEKGTDSFVVWANCQQPGRSIVNVCGCLGIPVNKLRFIVPDSGGGFGIKLALWPYIVSQCVVARKVDKPVKWIQTRREHLLAGTHTPDCVVDLELALKRDGKVLGLKIRDRQNDGSFVHTAGIYNLIKFATMVGCYDIKATQAELMSIVSNKAPTVQNRGVGKPAMIFTLERLMHRAAVQLGLDPAEIRFRNFVQPEQMPHTTPSGEIYESGNYPETLRKALAQIGYDGVKKEQESLRKQGKYIGVGLSASIEPGTSNLGYYYTSRGTPEYMGNAEGAIVSMDYDGNVNVLLGSVDEGQGHATSVAQVVADMLAFTPERVTMNTHMDSLVSPFLGHSGCYANRFNDVDMGAVIMATKKVRDKVLKIGAHMLGVPEGEVRLKDGAVCSAAEAKKSAPFKDIATVAYKQILLLPKGVEPGLKEVAYYKNEIAKMPGKEDFNVQMTHSNSVHAAVVEVDVESGMVSFRKYVIAHDCGRHINPGIVDGMAIGSTVHGIGTVLLEEFIYDENGQILTTSFVDYMKPLAVGLPRFELTHLESPCPTSLLGTKAVGEGGAIGSLAAIANAVEDALAPFGVKVTSLPITPEKVMRAIRETKVI
ncbi:MAG: xanthine dehydrogenase family protein molybdopterin-binding subunit [Betaproteobacteria bacterium]|nr:xanthine dehydrogenase family protein molybdopterin-binding subunit [Betaproteobacteria bacterium]